MCIRVCAVSDVSILYGLCVWLMCDMVVSCISGGLCLYVGYVCGIFVGCMAFMICVCVVCVVYVCCDCVVYV